MAISKENLENTIHSSYVYQNTNIAGKTLQHYNVKIHFHTIPKDSQVP